MTIEQHQHVAKNAKIMISPLNTFTTQKSSFYGELTDPTIAYMIFFYKASPEDFVTNATAMHSLKRSLYSLTLGLVSPTASQIASYSALLLIRLMALVKSSALYRE